MTEKKIPTEIYSRIVGYMRPVRDWNVGKRQEYADRAEYQLPGFLIQAKIAKDRVRWGLDEAK